MAEAQRDAELALLERAGAIRGLERQPRWQFPIRGPDGVERPLTTATGRAVRYTADWRYQDAATGEWVVEESKAFMQRDAALRIALMLAVHGIAVRITGAHAERKPGRARAVRCRRT